MPGTGQRQNIVFVEEIAADIPPVSCQIQRTVLAGSGLYSSYTSGIQLLFYLLTGSDIQLYRKGQVLQALSLQQIDKFLDNQQDRYHS